MDRVFSFVFRDCNPVIYEDHIPDFKETLHLINV